MSGARWIWISSAIAAAALSASDCADLPLKNLNECGNGVVEKPEECDRVTNPGDGTECGRPDDPLRACRFICMPGSETPKCPRGWSCESDGLCRLKLGICGNAILEPGEDCEPLLPLTEAGTACGAASDTMRACRYICARQGSPKCPTDLAWACGSDGICHLPLGVYEERVSPLDFAENDIRIGDFDGNGYGDIVGVDPSNVVVLFGSASGPFSRQVALRVDFVSGSPGVGDLDNDGLSDLVIPERTGLFVLRGQRDQTLAPLAYSSIPVRSGTSVKVIPVRVAEDDPYHQPIIITRLGAQFLMFWAQPDRPLPTNCSDTARVTCVPAGNRTLSDIAGRVPIANIHRPSDHSQVGFADEFVLAFNGDDHVQVFTEIRTCVGGTNCSIKPAPLGPQILLPGRISVPEGDPTKHHAVEIVDIDGDSNPDIMVTITDARNQPAIAIAYGDGQGGFFDASREAGRASIHAFNVIYTQVGGRRQRLGRLLYPMASGDLDGDHWADFAGVTQVPVTGMGAPAQASGVFLTVERNARTSTLAPAVLVPPPLSWDEAMMVDINHDGLIDVAAVSTGEQSIETLINAGEGFFNGGRVPTTFHPSSLRTGDFDGDRFPDIAVIEDGCPSSTSATSLSVLFGRPQATPNPPVSMGCLKYIQQIEPGNLVSGLALSDRITDLLAVSNQKADARGPGSIAVLRGTTERRMVAPYLLSTPDTPSRNQPLGVEVGHLDVSGDVFPDMIAVTQEISDQIGVAGRPTVWTVKGAGNAEFDPQQTRSQLLTMLPQCVASGFDLRWFLWTAGDIGAGDGGAVVGADNTDFGLGRRPATAWLVLLKQVKRGTDVMISCSRQRLPQGLGPVRQLELGDIDGDGRLDLLLAFPGAVSVYWNTGAPFVIEDRSPVVSSVPLPRGSGGMPLVPLSVAMFHALSPTSGRALGIATIDGVYRARLEGARTFVMDDALTPGLGISGIGMQPPGDTFRSPRPVRLLIDDLNRNGLDDLVLLADKKIHIYYAAEDRRGQVAR